MSRPASRARGRFGAPRRRAAISGRRFVNRRSSPSVLGARRRRIALAVAVPLGAAAVFLAARAAVEGDLFRVREVTFRGLVNARPSVLVAEAGLTRRRSLFDDLAPVQAALLRDPLVRAARVRRELPGRLIVEIEERRPVAYWSDDALWAVDADGRLLPLRPAHFGWDLPILLVSGRDPEGPPPAQDGRIVDGEVRALLRLVLGIRDRVPEIARRISVAELAPDGRVLFHLMGDGGVVKLRLETPLEKVALLPDVIRDLELKRRGFESVDLSFADQIVVRPTDPTLDESPAPRGEIAPAPPEASSEPSPALPEGAEPEPPYATAAEGVT